MFEIKYVFAILAVVFVVLGLVRLVRDPGRWHPQSRSGVPHRRIFAAVERLAMVLSDRPGLMAEGRRDGRSEVRSARHGAGANFSPGGDPVAPGVGFDPPGPIGRGDAPVPLASRIIAKVTKDWDPPNSRTTPEIVVNGATLAAARELNALPEWGRRAELAHRRDSGW